MQCPSCGFENMPGIQECGVCSTQLINTAENESVMPPRAKDRTIGQRINFHLQNNPTLSAASEKAHNTEGTLANNINRIRNYEQNIWKNVRITWSWLKPRNIWLLLISIIPGFGYIFGRKDRKNGFRFLYGSIISLLIAIATYKTYFADVLVWGILISFIISVFVAADSILPTMHKETSRFFSRAGITLLVVSAVCSSYLLIVFSPNSPIFVGTVTAQPLTNLVTINDTLLLWKSNLNRGDIVVGQMVEDQQGIGVIVGIPGDSIQIVPNGTSYLNRKPIQLPKQDTDFPVNQNSLQTYSKVIPDDEFLIVQTIQGGQGYEGNGNLHSISGIGYVRRENILGRVAAVTWPPAHRKLIKSGHNYE